MTIRDNIPKTVGVSTKVDVPAFARTGLDELADPDANVTVPLGDDNPVEGLKRVIIMLFQKPPSDNDSGPSFPADLRDHPVISATKPAELTALPDATWSEFHTTINAAKNMTESTNLLIGLMVLVGAVVPLILLFALDVHGAAMIALIAVFSATILLTFCFGFCLGRKAKQMRKEAVEVFSGRFASAGYKLTIEKPHGHACLHIRPLDTSRV